MTTKRFNIADVEPAAYDAIMGLEKYLTTIDLDPKHKLLIKLRASLINGCAFCIDMHTREARKLGETEQRLYLVSAWRDAPQFSEEERIMLDMTEQITHISQHGLSSETYAKAIEAFGEKKTAQILATIITINSWNRLCVALQVQPA